jgi:hypothetical protein
MNAPLPPELRARVLDAVARQPAPSRRLTILRSVLLLVLGFGALTATFISYGVRFHERPHAYVFALALVWLPLAFAVTWGGVGRGRSMLGRPTPWLAAVVVGTPLALLATWAVVAVGWPSVWTDASGWPDHMVCNRGTMLLSIGPFLALTAIRRRTDTVNPWLTGAAIGTVAGVWAAIVLHFICGHTRPVHMLLGHFLPIVLLALIGTVFAGPVLGIRLHRSGVPLR